jgi:hypothetical protein
MVLPSNQKRLTGHITDAHGQDHKSFEAVHFIQ